MVVSSFDSDLVRCASICTTIVNSIAMSTLLGLFIEAKGTLVLLTILNGLAFLKELELAMQSTHLVFNLP